MNNIINYIYHTKNGNGRLGNAIFRYFATILLSNKFNIEYNDNDDYDDNICVISDHFFLNILYNNQLQINKNILLNDYFQFDIYLEYKYDIIDYMNKYKNIHTILTDNKDNKTKYKIVDIIDNKVVPIYDLVIHIRLEDFINIGWYINVEYIIKLLDNIDFSKIHNIAIVMKEPETNTEKEYLDTIKMWFYNKNIRINIESNDVITDLQIMKQCKILVCSKSTLSWCACLLSVSIEKCYFPNYKQHLPFQNFRRPHINTIYYDIGEI